MHHFADEFFQFILARLHAPLGLPADSFLHSIEAGLHLRQQQVRDSTTHGLKRLEIDNCCLGLAMSGNHDAPWLTISKVWRISARTSPTGINRWGLRKYLVHAQQLVGPCAAHTR